jgi:hypothetical protein
MRPYCGSLTTETNQAAPARDRMDGHRFEELSHIVIEASAVSFQVSEERSGSQDDDGAEPWELDIASDRSISRTSIKCVGDRRRADSDIGKKEPCGEIKVRSSSHIQVGPDLVAGFMNNDQTKANLPVYELVRNERSEIQHRRPRSRRGKRTPRQICHLLSILRLLCHKGSPRR